MLTPTQIARELLNPTKTWHVIHIGGSRASDKQRFICTYSGLAWGGASLISANTAASTGHASDYGTLVYPGPTDNTYIPGEPVNPWTSLRYGSSIFNGAAEPNSLGAQLCYGDFSESYYPLVYSRLIANGGGAKVRCAYHRHATGISGGSGVLLVMAPGSSYFTPLDPPAYHSPVITDSTGTGLEMAEAVIPAGFDWSSYPQVMLGWIAMPGGSNPNGSLFQWADLPWIESDGPCLVHHSQAIAGGRWAYWLNDTFAPAARWTDYNGLFGPNQILWSSTGVNSWGDDVATNAANLAGVIARFRAANPEGPVVLDTQYPAQYTAGRVCTWREAIFQVASVTPGVLVLDTYGLHDFEWWYSRGLINDGVHASDAGVAQYMTDLGTLAHFRGRT